MKLLIVDDQRSVVQGLLHCTDWAALGFDQVEGALNAIDARASLQRREAEVMLCDIEMPVESGLDLLKWMRGEGMRTRCIFLTAYAKFQYAQEAVRLGGFDYIMQPAPYAQVIEAVEKALREVRAERASQELAGRGALFDEQKKALVWGLLRDFLMGAAAEGNLAAFEELGLIPLRGQAAWLALMQPLRWQDGRAPWDPAVLGLAVDNICGEVFAPLEVFSAAVVMPQEQTLAIVLQSREGEALERDLLARQLTYLQSACSQYLHLSAAFYLTGPEPFAKAGQMWQALLEKKSENVALKSGVYTGPGAGRAEPFHIPQIAGWRRLLQEGYPLAMEQEACQLLDQLAANNRLDRTTLRYFYQDFMRMLFTAPGPGQEGVRDMFREPDALELYRNGMKTVDDMKALIHYAALGREGSPSPDSQDQDAVALICRYVAGHLQDELRREELAEAAHLNPDYLNRLFKKEMGLTLKEYVIRQKMEEARSLLRTTALPVSLIAAKVGYSNFAHFSASYKKLYGRSPQEERQNTP